jgi:hypothetical protein
MLIIQKDNFLSTILKEMKDENSAKEFITKGSNSFSQYIEDQLSTDTFIKPSSKSEYQEVIEYDSTPKYLFQEILTGRKREDRGVWFKPSSYNNKLFYGEWPQSEEITTHTHYVTPRWIDEEYVKDEEEKESKSSVEVHLYYNKILQETFCEFYCTSCQERISFSENTFKEEYQCTCGTEMIISKPKEKQDLSMNEIMMYWCRNIQKKKDSYVSPSGGY